MRWLLAMLLLAGCTDTGTAEEAACSHFHNVAVDASDGVLTGDELRNKIREVADRAAGSDVEEPARNMLAAITKGDGFDAAVREMSDACDPYR